MPITNDVATAVAIAIVFATAVVDTVLATSY